MTIRSFISLSLASILISVLSTFAAAGMIVQVENKDAGNFFPDTVFDRFDPAMGTLTQVTLDIDLSLNVSIEDFGLCSVLDLCTGDIPLEVNGVHSLLPLSKADSVSVTSAQVAAGESFALEVVAMSIDFPNLSDFTLPGLNPRLSVSVPYALFGLPMYFDRRGTVTLTYQFDQAVVVSPIPEPAILTLFGFGLAWLGLSRRKRFASLFI